jgi:hypothetical protein
MPKKGDRKCGLVRSVDGIAVWFEDGTRVFVADVKAVKPGELVVLELTDRTVCSDRACGVHKGAHFYRRITDG